MKKSRLFLIKVRLVLVSGFAIMLFQGCMIIGPDYRKPDLTVPEQWCAAPSGDADSVIFGPHILADWWFTLNDLILTAQRSLLSLQDQLAVIDGTCASNLIRMYKAIGGGIGIMNIMLVSVTERTRAIGIRLAIGAREGEVLMQFLVEAIVLSSFGGFAGIIIGLSSSAVGARFLKVPFVFSLGIVLLAFLFSGAVGVIFGFFPARQAARFNPIDALRHE